MALFSKFDHFKALYTRAKQTNAHTFKQLTTVAPSNNPQRNISESMSDWSHSRDSSHPSQ